MTAKEKAEELVNKYLQIYDGRVPQGKKCALICVDEILDAVTTIADKRFDFYTEVKKEIEKL